MPTAAAAAWRRALMTVDDAVAAPLKRSSVLDAMRAKLLLEETLYADGQAYGDIDPWVIEHAQEALTALSSKVGKLTANSRPRKRSVFSWPLWPVLITSPYGEREHPVLGDIRLHRGLDLYAQEAQPVNAAAEGTVLFAGWNGGYGKQVELLHEGHLVTSYSHLDTVMVSEGETVKRGQPVGLAGMTGRTTGVHLHFEVRKEGETIDPAPIMPDPTTRPPGPSEANTSSSEGVFELFGGPKPDGLGGLELHRLASHRVSNFARLARANRPGAEAGVAEPAICLDRPTNVVEQHIDQLGGRLLGETGLLSDRLYELCLRHVCTLPVAATPARERT